MNRPLAERPPTYLRVGAGVYPVYGDDVRGWSPRADDFQGFVGSSPWEGALAVGDHVIVA